MMRPPMVSVVTFNRMGLTVKNLSRLLQSKDDFELYIVDSNSKDNTWDFIQSLCDPRIKSRIKLDLNRGPIYAANLNLSKRKPDQYFFNIDTDVCIKSNDWISKFMRVFEKFPEAGLLGVAKSQPYLPYFPEVIKKEKDGVEYLQLKNGWVGAQMDFVSGHFQCLRPELINIIGYWSEESYFGDAEISIRVNNYTPFKAGFMTNIDIDMTQHIACEACMAKYWCKMDRKDNTCLSVRNQKNKNEYFVNKFRWKYEEYFKELKEGTRSVYCASIHDPESQKNHAYNKVWAIENFKFYEINAN